METAIEIGFSEERDSGYRKLEMEMMVLDVVPYPNRDE